MSEISNSDRVTTADTLVMAMEKIDLYRAAHQEYVGGVHIAELRKRIDTAIDLMLAPAEKG